MNPCRFGLFLWMYDSYISVTVACGEGGVGVLLS